ncbi:MAG: histidine kinase N-terminal 7TM domain-containing protein [Spirochaetota bacterium]
MNFYNILPLVTSILYLQAGIFVVALGHRSKPHVFFALLSLAFATYAFGSACYIGADSLRHAAFWYRVATPGMRLYPILTLLFFLSLAAETPSVFIRFLSRPAVLVLLFILPLILITATFLDPDYFSGFRRFEAGWLNESFPSSGLSMLYLSYLVGYFILSNLVLVLWRRYTDSMRISRQSALIQAFSIIMFCLALFTSVVLPHLAPGGHTPRLISSVPVIWLAGIVYTILRLRLFLYQSDSSRRLLVSL